MDSNATENEILFGHIATNEIHKIFTRKVLPKHYKSASIKKKLVQSKHVGL